MKMKAQPRIIKMDKPLHRSVVISFMERLPSSAGADFIWDFLVFQFYTYSQQNHDRRPMPSWFLGKEAWNRWLEHSEEAHWHSKQWASERKLVNPVLCKKYKKIEDSVFLKEKLKMSRISGPNYCFMKFDNPYDPDDDICFSCPFKKDCEVLCKKTKTGSTIMEEINNNLSDNIVSHVRIMDSVLGEEEYEE